MLQKAKSLKQTIRLEINKTSSFIFSILMNSVSPSLQLKELGFERELKEVKMNKGVSLGDCLPKFFKVYLPDESGDDLVIPISFNSCLPKSLPKTVIVRSIYGNIWTMAFRKSCGDIERFVMVNGWKRIVKGEDLKGGEFLEFEFDGSLLFNFCIYGHATCKKLRSSVQFEEMDQSDGNDGSSSDVIIVLDDEDDNGDVHDDQDYGKEYKSSENIIVLDDDDINGVKDYNEEDTSSEDITVLDDDDDDMNDVQNYGEEDTSSKDIIVIDDDENDDDGDDDYADDENERMRGVETEGKEKGSSGEHDRRYLDNHMNPFLRVNQNLQSNNNLRIPTKLIIEYGLHFPEFINLIDPLEKKYGKLMKRKVEGQTVMGFGSILRRNKVKLTDKVICELERKMNGLVREIKVHVIRG